MSSNVSNTDVSGIARSARASATNAVQSATTFVWVHTFGCTWPCNMRVSSDGPAWNARPPENLENGKKDRSWIGFQTVARQDRSHPTSHVYASQTKILADRTKAGEPDKSWSPSKNSNMCWCRYEKSMYTVGISRSTAFTADAIYGNKSRGLQDCRVRP